MLKKNNKTKHSFIHDKCFLGLVLLEDLVSGAYERRKAAEAEAKRKRIEKKRKEKEEAELAAQEALKK